jgi:N-acyl homoserine lactone hydrolase
MIKRVLLGGLLLVLIGAGVALAMSFSAERLPLVGAEPAFEIPSPPATQGVTLHAIPAGSMESTAGMAYRGGSLTEKRVFGMGGILVRHPQGDVLFDTGFGKDVDQHIKTIPLLMRLTSSYAKGPTVAEQLVAGGYDLKRLSGVIITHAHWDHVSGLPDLGASVILSKEEEAFIEGGDEAATLIRSLPGVRYEPYNYLHGAYLGFEPSLDYYGDGSIVLVPVPGHTPGSIIAFVNTSDGKRYALIGDLVWQKEGIDLPAERPWISRRLVDKDPEQVRAAIVQMHRIQKQMPDLIVVPAHDQRVWEQLPRFPG